MRIGIDGYWVLRKRRGIGNYTLHLIDELANVDSGNEYVIYVDRDDTEGVLPRKDNFLIRRIPSASYPIWEQCLLPRRVLRDRLEILHSTGNTAPLARMDKVRRVLTMHDLMFLKDRNVLAHSPSVYQHMGRIYRAKVAPRAAQRADQIITVSEYSRFDILDHFPQLDASRILVTYEAADLHFKPKQGAAAYVREKLGVEGPYVLCLGGVDPRKNTARTISAFLEIRRTTQSQISLVIVGMSGRDRHLLSGVSSAELEKQVVFIDFVPQELLAHLYTAALLFVYPSLYEGFGLPILEAMACGTPVITSRTTSMPEVAGDAACLVDPRDSRELINVLTNLLNDSAMRADMAKRGGERAKLFSWRTMAQQTLRIYESIAA